MSCEQISRNKSRKERESRYDFATRALTGLFLIVLFCIVFFKLPAAFFSGLIFAILGIILLFEWPRLFKLKSLTFWLLMPFYPILPFILMVALNQNDAYHSLVFFIFVLVFSFDLGSYAFGSTLGSHRIAPTISPRKSWEGALGGAIFSYAAFNIMLWSRGIKIPPAVILPLSLTISGLSLSGDLFESWLKRRAGVKDTANYLPGHGGFLDRFDGILFVVPFFFVFREYLAKLLGG